MNAFNSQGFRDAEVISDEIVNIDDEFIDLKIKLDEVRKYYIRDIEWVGNLKYTDEFLTEKLGIKKGDVYNRKNRSKNNLRWPKPR